MKRTIDILTKYQKHLIGIAIFLSLFAVSITIDNTGANLNLKNHPSVMILLVALSIVIAVTYMRIDQHRIQQLSQEIESLSIDPKEKRTSLLTELTTRQKEVYELIISGKSNKEIMQDLFIEQSTLKSHINQIYKKLSVKNRRALKSNVID